VIFLSHGITGFALIASTQPSMKILRVCDLYFERVAVSSYVTWGRASGPAGPDLSVPNIGKRQFPSDHRQRNGYYGQGDFRPEIDRHIILHLAAGKHCRWPHIGRFQNRRHEGGSTTYQR
jgi:hypothetical protein